MSLYYNCGDDCEWFYEIIEDLHPYKSEGLCSCYGCGSKVSIGDDVGKILWYTRDEDGNDRERQVLGMMCEDCLDMISNLKALGYCLDATPGFVRIAHGQYLNRLPKNNILKVQK